MVLNKKGFSPFKRMFSFLSFRAGDLATLVILALVFLIILDIVLRRFFNSPLTFSFEIVQISLSVIVFSCIAYTTSIDRHVSIDVFISRFSPGAQKIINHVMDVLCALFFGLLGWRNIVQGIRILDRGTMTGILEIPFYPFYFFMACCSIIACLTILANTFISISGEE